ncbi:DUF2637 domain-containing protein [Streptomyces sp. NPDC003388]
MTRIQRLLTLAAGAVIVGLTGAAFWLSYAHLHTVAAEHGLASSPARAWAWPGCLDLFVIAGELLMLRASLARRVDGWAIALVVIGSGGSIALNVLGVDGSDPLAYVTAAVPPTAALLAFGALMRQVHMVLAGRSVPAEANAPEEAPVFAPVADEQAPVFAPDVTGPDAEPTEQAEAAEEPEEEPERLTTEQASRVIERCWATGVGIRETARQATRAPSTVKAAFARLDQGRGVRPVAGQLTLMK